MMQRKTSAFQLGPRASALGGFVLLLIVAPIMFFLLPSLRASEEAIRESQNLKQENLISFLEKLDAAKGATALHPEIHRLEAQTAMVLWRQTRDRYISSPTPPMDQLAQEQRIENAMERAILRQSRGIGLYLYRAQLRLEFWEEGTRRALSQGSHLLQKQAEAHLLRAKDDVDMAFRLYPTSAANHYVKASILDLQHRPEEAKRLYQEALRLSDNAGRANAPSQELRPFEKSHALLRLQDNKGAVRAMEEHFRILLSATNVPSPLVQRALNEFRKTVRQQTAFWYHPVMDAVADQAIANLLEKP